MTNLHGAVENRQYAVRLSLQKLWNYWPLESLHLLPRSDNPSSLIWEK